MSDIVKKDQFDIDLELFSSQCCKGFNQDETKYFYNLCLTLKANPFKREIWGLKVGGGVSYFIGRDLYRRIAQEQPNYDGHIVNAIYSKDRFNVVNGQVHHETANFSDRGQLVGAYCVVRVKGRSLDYLTICNLSEYKGNTAIWNSKTETMIKKVAEAQALRGAFQGLFSGTYEESEQWEEKPKKQAPEVPQKMREAAEMIIENMPSLELDLLDPSEAYNLCEACGTVEELETLWKSKPEWKKSQPIISIVGARKKEILDGNGN